MAQRLTDGRILDDGKDSGMVETFYYDQHTGGFTIETTQEVSGLLEVNTALANDAPSRWREWTHVANIPNVILMQLAQQGILAPGGAIVDEPRFRAWLNDRDNRAFRTRMGKV